MKKIALSVLLYLITVSFISAQEPVTYEQAFPNLSFEFPLEIQNTGDGSNRLFVVEQSGKIKVFENDKNTSQQRTFIDLKNEITFNSGQEIGLLGLAFHPNYKQNGYFYVFHTEYGNTVDWTQAIVVARYKVSGDDPNKADASSRLELFKFEKTYNSNNHNGGKIAFGPDGYLYISVGDGGGYSDPNKNAQNLNVVFGSMLRIDVDLNGNNPRAANGNYEIPNDNPRVGKSGMDEIYAWGLRNIWKFSFDSQTNRLWGADVGQDAYEEINLINKGGNYGWKRFEGHTTESSTTNLATSPDIKPVFQYNHDNGDVSVTGGYVYRGASNNSALQGKYVFADYLSGRVWSLNYDSGNNSATSQLLFRTNGQYISSFGLDESGELYFSGYGSSAKIFKVVGGDDSPAPPIDTTTDVDGVGDWRNLENGTNGVVETIVVKGDNVYVGGSFSRVGSVSATNIAVYNKNDGWKNLAGGANGKVSTLALAPNGNLYAGGEFTSIGGKSASNVAVWNGSSWSALGSGTNGTVAEIALDNQNRVYVAGGFESAGGLPVKNIALWTNGSWSSLTDSGTGDNGTNNEIRALAVDENNLLYVGGNFDVAGGKSAVRIATWNGSNWSTLGQGTSGFVQAITVTPSYIYAGGNFSIAGGKTVNRIARWVRSSRTWQALGDGVSGNINTMTYKSPYVYVAGNFETAANVSGTNFIMKNAARWSSANGWEALGPQKDVGLDNNVSSMAFSDDLEHIYFGGSFGTAGKTVAQNIAVWGTSFDCSDERLSVEYRLGNTSWVVAANTQITVDEGTKVELKLSTSAQAYSIELPDGNGVGGEHDLGAITLEQEGVYKFITDSGCSTTLNINVIPDDITCTASSIVAEYKVNGEWQSGNGNLQVDPGTSMVLSMIPNGIGLAVTLPNGTTVGDNYNLGSVTEADSGTYIFTSEQGCASTLNLVVGTPVECEVTLIPEYNINGTWQSGTHNLQVDLGASMMLSALPNGVDVTITLPDGSIVGDNFNLGEVTESESGIYLITSEDGCTTQLNLSVGSTVPTECDGELIPEYRLNGIWQSGKADLQVEAGTSMVLSMLPNGIGLTITLPDGSTVGDNYYLGTVAEEDSGTYVFTSAEGCISTLNLSVDSNGNNNCTSAFIIPEYSLNGKWFSGNSDITVDEGTSIVLSMLPNGRPLTITLPNGTVVGDNYAIRNVSTADSGTYILSSEGECRALNIQVTDLPNCSSNLTIPEYNLNNVWSSGQNFLQVAEGEDVVLSMLPNGIDLTITLPNGNKVGDNHVIKNITPSDAGVYTLEPANGCKTTLQMFVTASGSAKITSLVGKVVDDGSLQISKSLVMAYPNPTVNKVFIELGETVCTSFELVIHDIKQQRVYSEQIENNLSNRIEVDLSGYSEGIYFVSIHNERGEISTHKIVKTR